MIPVTLGAPGLFMWFVPCSVFPFLSFGFATNQFGKTGHAKAKCLSSRHATHTWGCNAANGNWRTFRQLQILLHLKKLWCKKHCSLHRQRMLAEWSLFAAESHILLYELSPVLRSQMTPHRTSTTLRLWSKVAKYRNIVFFMWFQIGVALPASHLPLNWLQVCLVFGGNVTHILWHCSPDIQLPPQVALSILSSILNKCGEETVFEI